MRKTSGSCHDMAEHPLLSGSMPADGDQSVIRSFDDSELAEAMGADAAPHSLSVFAPGIDNAITGC